MTNVCMKYICKVIYDLSVDLVTFDLGLPLKVKSRSQIFSNADLSVGGIGVGVNFKGGKGQSQKRFSNFFFFSSAVPSGSGAFQMPTRPSSSASSSAAAAATSRGEGPISETLQ